LNFEEPEILAGGQAILSCGRWRTCCLLPTKFAPHTVLDSPNNKDATGGTVRWGSSVAVSSKSARHTPLGVSNSMILYGGSRSSGKHVLRFQALHARCRHFLPWFTVALARYIGGPCSRTYAIQHLYSLFTAVRAPTFSDWNCNLSAATTGSDIRSICTWVPKRCPRSQ
jgi:hypothetical protein